MSFVRPFVMWLVFRGADLYVDKRSVFPDTTALDTIEDTLQKRPFFPCTEHHEETRVRSHGLCLVILRHSFYGVERGSLLGGGGGKWHRHSAMQQHDPPAIHIRVPGLAIARSHQRRCER